MILNIKQLDTELPLPTYARPGDAGLDLYSTEDVFLQSGERSIIATGIAIEIPDGYCGYVVPRSGLAAKNGLTIVNAPGLIDSGYRGEVKVVLLNTDNSHGHHVKRGDRIAQLVIQKFESVEWSAVHELNESDRDGGLGSTGS